jgi:dTMP kinase
MTMPRGWLITLEGGEGAGKSTQLKVIGDWLAARGRQVVVTREPGGTLFGERIREILLHKHDRIDPDTEVLLMFAARSEHIAKVIRPALASGKTVLCDRFTDATYAYQGAGRGVAADRIAKIESWVQKELRPNLTILLDLPIELGHERVRNRGGTRDRFEREELAFFERVRAAYLAGAAREPNRVHVVDASREVAEVTRTITEILERVVHD